MMTLAARVLQRYKAAVVDRFSSDQTTSFAQQFFRRYPKLKRFAPERVVAKAGGGSSHGEARQHGDEVWLFSKFWDLDKKTQDFVFAHELGHLAASRKGLQWLMKAAENAGVDPWDTSSLPFGQFNVEEAFADSFASFFLEPGELSRRYPAWEKIVETVV